MNYEKLKSCYSFKYIEVPKFFLETNFTYVIYTALVKSKK